MNSIVSFYHSLQKQKFLFEELVKRDFKQKYKRTVLGMGWSILSPLLTLLVLDAIFSNYLGGNIPHYVIYLFCGNLVYSFFRESTAGGMHALLNNANIFSKVNVPKYIFLLSKNVSTWINFSLSLCIFYIFVVWEGLPITWLHLYLLYPIFFLIIFNLGIGMILSAYFVFFRDLSYLYDLITLIIMYASCIFYPPTIVPKEFQDWFLANPVYVYINYFRTIVMQGQIPSLEMHVLCAVYAIVALAIGICIYRKYNHEFLYYV